MKYVKSKVVMLPTEKRSLILKNIHGYPLFVSYGSKINDSRCEWQHLYFLSDKEEIKEGDWFYSFEYNDYYRASPSEIWSEGFEGKVRKIIATSDKELNKLGIARPSDEFLKEYCELGGMDEVLVRYESFIYNPLTGKEYSSQDNVPYEDCEKKYKLKVSSDNIITIKLIKESWSKEEVETLFLEFTKQMTTLGLHETQNWLKENL